jgi:hypothetical protein
MKQGDTSFGTLADEEAEERLAVPRLNSMPDNCGAMSRDA